MGNEDAARAIVTNVFLGLIDNGHRKHFPDLTYSEAVVATILSAHVFAAEAAGRPLTERTLAERVELRPERIRPRLNYLRDKQFMIRGAHGLTLNRAVLSMNKSLSSSARLIVEAAEGLTKIMSLWPLAFIMSI